MIVVEPSALVEVMESTPAIVENFFSSGSATDEATVSGLAPGRVAETVIVGKSTLGRSLTGSWKYASTPAPRIDAMMSAVAIGRRTKRSVGFISGPAPGRRGRA